MDTRDIEFMKIALAEAQKAAQAGEPPIGAVFEVTMEYCRATIAISLQIPPPPLDAVQEVTAELVSPT